MKKLTACVGVFSHSAVNDILKLEEELHRMYELIRRNDTRWFVF